jgi:hypothetical protein
MPAQSNDDQALLRTYLTQTLDQLDDAPSLLISYLTLRRGVGMIGIALPFVLAIGDLLLQGHGLQSSISSYYYTVMRDVFVGALWAIAVFLWTYKGYDWRDDLAGNIASLSAIGVALFPTAPAGEVTAREQIISAVHLSSATVFFLTLAYFCLALFRQTDALHPTREKLQRNRVYSACGYTILGCLALIAVVGLLPADSPLNWLAPIFWLEALAIVAFGVSWLTKGEAILKDKIPGRPGAPGR